MVEADLPLIDITFDGLYHKVSLPSSKWPPSIGRGARSSKAPARGAPAANEPTVLSVLESTCGRLLAGTATLLIGSAGAGTSTLLRVLSGRVSPSSGVGTIRYNGLTTADLIAQGADIRRLAVYSSSVDEHEALLTVRETLDFAYTAAVPAVPQGGVLVGRRRAPRATQGAAPMQVCEPPSRTRQPAAAAALGESAVVLESYIPPDTDAIIRDFGLTEAANTRIGSALVRGVSGGQKRRATVAESVLLNARIVCLDLPTTGLDSATALHVIRWAVDWAHRTGGILVAALQQAGPEIVELFDDAMLMTEGFVVYHGPVTPTSQGAPGVEEWLAGLGLVRPSYLDTASWAAEVLADPAAAAEQVAQHRQQFEDELRQAEELGDRGEASVAAHELQRLRRYPAADPHSNTMSPEGLAEAWALRSTCSMPPAPLKDTTLLPAIVPSGLPPKLLRTAYAVQAYGLQRGSMSTLRLVLLREMTLSYRNMLYIILRLLNCVLMSSILGTVYIRLPQDQFLLKLSLALFAVCFIAFINAAAIPIAAASRQVVYKHTASALYGERLYAAAATLSALPLVIVSDFLFGTILYFMSALGGDDIGRWLFFVCILIFMDLAVSTLYRSFTYATRNDELAMGNTTGFIALGLATGGFFVTRFQLPIWLIWLLYASPFFWSVVSIANNTFLDPAFDAPLPGSTVPRGQAYLSAMDLPYGIWWKLGGLLFLIGLFLIGALVLQPWALRKWRYDVVPGTRRAVKVGAAASVQPQQGLRDGQQISPSGPSAVAVTVPASSLLPFVPATLAYAGVSYSVGKPVRGVTADPYATLAAASAQHTALHSSSERKQLLRSISGLCRPGELLAIMGSSGAGKSTLLDTLLFRKTVGAVTGCIAMNGVEATHKLMSSVVAYVEQEDQHVGELTVRESLSYAADVLLDPAVRSAERARFLNGIIEMLDFSPLADRRVSTLSRGELKLLSVAVGMAGNPSILCLDEPTSGLSTKASRVVVSALRRLANSGRTIICTIHQPSAAVLFAFSHLQLLAPGGYPVYFGPMGNEAECIVTYLEGLPGVKSLPESMNPALWFMMQVDEPGSESGPWEQRDPEHEALVQARQSRARDRANELGLPPTVATAEDFSSFFRATRLHHTLSSAIATMLPPSCSASAAAPQRGLGDQLLPGPCDVEMVSLVTPALQAKAAEAMSSWAHPSQVTQPTVGAITVTHRPSWAAKMRATLWRLARVYTRDPLLWFARPVLAVLLALFFGLCYLSLDWNTFSGSFNGLGAILASAGFLGVLLFSTTVAAAYPRRAVFYRERAAGLASPSLFAVAVIAVEAVSVLLCTALFAPIFFYLWGPPLLGFGHCLWFMLLTWGTAYCYTLGAWCAAFLFPNAIISQVIGGFFLALSFLFGCVFVPPAYMPAGWRWFIEVDFAAWQTRGVAADIFPSCAGGVAAGCPAITVLGPAGPALVDRSAFIVNQLLEFNQSQRYLAVIYMMVNVAGFIGALYLMVRFVSHQQR